MKEVRLCRWCRDRMVPGAVYTVSSQVVVPDCYACGSWGPASELEWFELAEEVEVEWSPCDCGDQIRHNTGGNYHTGQWWFPGFAGDGEYLAS